LYLSLCKDNTADYYIVCLERTIILAEEHFNKKAQLSLKKTRYSLYSFLLQ